MALKLDMKCIDVLASWMALSRLFTDDIWFVSPLQDIWIIKCCRLLQSCARRHGGNRDCNWGNSVEIFVSLMLGWMSALLDLYLAGIQTLQTRH